MSTSVSICLKNSHRRLVTADGVGVGILRSVGSLRCLQSLDGEDIRRWLRWRFQIRAIFALVTYFPTLGFRRKDANHFLRIGLSQTNITLGALVAS